MWISRIFSSKASVRARKLMMNVQSLNGNLTQNSLQHLKSLFGTFNSFDTHIPDACLDSLCNLMGSPARGTKPRNTALHVPAKQTLLALLHSPLWATSTAVASLGRWSECGLHWVSPSVGVTPQCSSLIQQSLVCSRSSCLTFSPVITFSPLTSKSTK